MNGHCRGSSPTTTSPAEFAQYDLPQRGLATLVRASIHYDNTAVEIDRFVSTLDEVRDL